MSNPEDTPETPRAREDAITDSPQRSVPKNEPSLLSSLPKGEAITPRAAVTAGRATVEPIPASSSNQAEIARIRRKLGWYRLSFWILFALMPTSCIGPMSLLNLIRDRDVQTGVMLTGAILAPVCLGCMILLWRDWRRCTRSLVLAELANRIGWRYIEKPPPERYFRLKRLRTFDHANDDRGFNLLEGEVAGTAAWTIDFIPDAGVRSFTLSQPGAGAGDSSTQTVLLLKEAAIGLPDFDVSPKGWMDRVGQMLGGGLIPLPEYPEFNQQMALRGRDRQAIAERLSSDFIALCLKENGVTVEVQNGDLVLFRRKKILSVAQFIEMIEHAGAMIEALRST
jgi:hypothetical protein